jgi:hypothetical protein
LKFKEESLEKEYPMKNIRPFDVTVLFKIVLWLLVLCIGIRRLEMMVFTISGATFALGMLNEEIINFALFVSAILLEGLVYCFKPFRITRGFFIMAYIYFSIAFASYYTQKDRLFSVTMYS